MDNLSALALQEKNRCLLTRTGRTMTRHSENWKQQSEIKWKKHKNLYYNQTHVNAGFLSVVYWSARSVRRSAVINSSWNWRQGINSFNYLPGQRTFVRVFLICRSSRFSSESWMAWNLVKCTKGHQSFLSLMFLRTTSSQSSLYWYKAQVWCHFFKL